MRHGETDSNQAAALDTAIPGAALNANGLRQAQELIEKWQRLKLPSPDFLLASTLHRTAQTIIPLASSLGISFERCADVNEVEAGSLEMKNDAESIGTYLNTIGQWMQGNLQGAIPDGPDGRQVLSRFDRAVERCYQQVGPEGVAVIVAHGAVIRYWACLRANNLPFALAGVQPMFNTGVTYLRGKPKEFEALLWSDYPVDSWEYDPSVTKILPSHVQPVNQ